jgi:hypothetical protein
MRNKLTNSATFYLFIGILFFTNSSSFAQVRVQAILNPPYTPYVANYLSLQNVGILTLQNTTTSILQVKLKGRIDDGSGTFVKTKDGYKPLSAITLLPNQIRTLLGSELAFFNRTNTETNAPTALQNSIIKDGILPEGNYTFCVQVLDFTTDAPLSPAVPSGCVNFQIGYLTPPIITAPQCGEPVKNLPFAFQWTRPTGNLSGGNLQYDLFIVKVLAGQNPNEVIRGAITSNIGNPVVKRNLTVPTYVYLPIDPPLEFGATYAWAVKARDVNNKLFFENNGLTEVCTFVYSYKTGGISPILALGIKPTITPIFPLDKDTLPFTQMPIIVQIAPQNPTQSYTQLDFANTFVQNTEGSPLYHAPSSALEIWTDGPWSNLKTKVPDASTEQGHLLPLTMRGTYPTYERGKTYSWHSNGAISQKPATAGAIVVPTVYSTDVSGVNIGMPTPQLTAPAYDATASAVVGTSVKLTWLTGKKTGSGLPKYALNYVNAGSNTPVQISPVNEAYILEVAKDAAFTQIIDVKSGKINFDPQANVNNSTHQYNESAYEAAVYKSIDVTTDIINDKGTYYWRVGYLKDPTVAATFSKTNVPTEGVFYRMSGVSRFVIGGTVKSGSSVSASGDVVCSTCKAADYTAAAVRTTAYANGGTEELTIGNFKMTLIESTMAADGKLTGKGKIKLPLIGSDWFQVKVEFKDIVTDINKHVVKGNVTATKRTDGGPTLAPDFNPERLAPDALGTAISTIFGGPLSNIVNDAAASAKKELGFEVPLGLSLNNGDQEFAINKMTFSPKGAAYDAYINVAMPGEAASVSGNSLAFGAQNICFSPDNIFCGDAIFVLLKSFPVKIGNGADQHIITLNGAETYNIESSKPEKTTYVVVKNFKIDALNVSAEYAFPTNVFIDNVDASKPLVINIKGTGTSWSNWVGEISFNAFKLKDNPDFVFRAKAAGDVTAWYDHKASWNPEGMPTITGKTNINSKTWNGFFMKSLVMECPAAFKKAGSTDRITTEIRDLIIDNQGLTGYAQADGLLKLDEGSLGGWYFSIDHVDIKFLNSGFQSSAMNGKLILPISGDKKTEDVQLDYSCNLTKPDAASSLKFQFDVKLKENLKAAVWLATMQLGGSIAITVTGENIVAKADFNGFLTVNTSTAYPDIKPSLDMKLIKFEHLLLSTEYPYISQKGEFIPALASPEKSVAGFSVTLSDLQPSFSVDVATKTGKAGFSFGIAMTLGGIDALPTASTNIGIFAAIKFDGNLRPQWSGLDLQLNEIGIKGAVGPVSVDGRIRFLQNDPDYGDGIFGSLKATVLNVVEIKAMALFAKKGGNDIMMVDAQAMLATPVTMGPGIAFKGFGGGFYYNLTRKTLPDISQLQSAKETDPLSIETVRSRYGYDLNHFGFSARIILSSTDGKMFIASGGLVMELYNSTNADGRSNISVKSTTITLEGALFADPTKTDYTSAMVYAKGEMTYDFPKQIFKADLDITLNMVDVITGTGKMALMVDAANKKWYFKLGVPDNRVKFDVIRIISLDAYLVTGNDGVPDMPEPPDAFKTIMAACGVTLDTKSHRQTDKMTTGAGFAFGASAHLDEKHYDFLCFFMKAGGGIGFDINLQEFKVGCDGPGSALPGINGWYANGQFYAWLEVAAGIHVDMAFVKGDFAILDCKAALLLQAGLPNPYWFKGWVAGQFNILDGLISGTMNFKIAVGTECQLDQGILGGVPIISKISPEGESPKASIMSDVNIACNFPVGREFSFDFLKSDGKTIEKHTFLIELKTLNITSVAGSKPYSLSDLKVGYSNDGKQIRASIPASLDPHILYAINIEVQVKERMANGTLRTEFTYTNAAGVPTVGNYIENKSTTFLTGDCLPNLEAALAGSYPMRGQRYFLRQDGIGFVELTKPVNCLNLGLRDSEFDVVARFQYYKAGTEMVQSYETVQVNDYQSYDRNIMVKAAQLTNVDVPITAIPGKDGVSRIDFNVPDLPAQTVVSFNLVQIPKNAVKSTETVTATYEKQDARINKYVSTGLFSATSPASVAAYTAGIPSASRPSGGSYLSGSVSAALGTSAYTASIAAAASLTGVSSPTFSGGISQAGIQSTLVNGILSGSLPPVMNTADRRSGLSTKRSDVSSATVQNLVGTAINSSKTVKPIREGKSLFSFYFKTSKYKNLAAKMADCDNEIVETNLTHSNLKDIDVLNGALPLTYATCNCKEPFDDYDLNGSSITDDVNHATYKYYPLIEFGEDYSNYSNLNAYQKIFVKPMYETAARTNAMEGIDFSDAYHFQTNRIPGEYIKVNCADGKAALTNTDILSGFTGYSSRFPPQEYQPLPSENSGKLTINYWSDVIHARDYYLHQSGLYSEFYNYWTNHVGYGYWEQQAKIWEGTKTGVTFQENIIKNYTVDFSNKFTSLKDYFPIYNLDDVNYFFDHTTYLKTMRQYAPTSAKIGVSFHEPYEHSFYITRDREYKQRSGKSDVKIITYRVNGH